MRGNRLGVGLLWAGLAGLGAASAASAAPAPCAEITAACESAGFTPGDARGGNGLKLDCVDPIMQGTPQPRRARLPLPAVDPQVVAACKAGDPKFGAAKSAAAPAVAAPTVAAPSAPVVPAAPTVPTMVPPLPPGAKRPNIVFVLTDDLAWNLVQYMPHVLQMQKDGVTFANYFVTDSLCCPSRSSIFTGRYPHDTGVFTNGHDDGGYLVFRNRGNEQVTFAKALAAAGYRTAMLGKYLNGYEPRQHPPAPGWTSWAVAGAAYREFKYALNEDGKVVRFGDSPGDYLTDVLSGIATRFVKQAAGAPFLIEIATFAPHAPYIPAPRDADALPGLAAPRTPAFDVAPDTSMPDWVRKLPALTGADKAAIDKAYRMRAQSVLAVDAMIGQLQAAVAASGQAQNTYFVFSSDNGLHMGEHRMMPGKMTPYDMDIHVPLIVTGPGIPAGRRVEEVTENVDLCPTFAELGFAAAPATVDGRSLVPLLRGESVAEWRSVALIEHHGPHRDPRDPDAPGARSGNPVGYEAIRGRTSVYVEYNDGLKEYHDLAADPYELRNTFAALPAAEKAALHAILAATKECHDARSCWSAQRPAPVVTQK